MNITYLVVIMADFNSETLYQLASDASGHHAVRYITEIHVIRAEISNMCYLGSGRFWVHLPWNVLGNGVVSED